MIRKSQRNACASGPAPASPSRRLGTSLWLVLLCCILGACSSGTKSVQAFRADLGRAPRLDILRGEVAHVLESSGYQVRSATDTFMETEWRNRDPETTQQALDVAGIRDRARVSFNRRGQDHYVARVRIEYQVMTAGAWRPAVPTDKVVAQYQGILRDVEERLGRYMTQH